jgi:hypothetical protein
VAQKLLDRQEGQGGTGDDGGPCCCRSAVTRSTPPRLAATRIHVVDVAAQRRACPELLRPRLLEEGNSALRPLTSRACLGSGGGGGRDRKGSGAASCCGSSYSRTAPATYGRSRAWPSFRSGHGGAETGRAAAAHRFLRLVPSLAAFYRREDRVDVSQVDRVQRLQCNN